MSIDAKIREEIKQCMREKNAFKRDILKTVLGEVQSKTIVSSTKLANVDPANSTSAPSDEDYIKVLKKSKQGVEETIPHVSDPDKLDELGMEISIYDSYLPKTLSVEEIVKALEDEQLQGTLTAIKSAKSDGQATGIAMGYFKKNAIAVDGKDVSEAMKKIRT